MYFLSKLNSQTRHLGALQCHFTWGLCTNPSLLLHRRDKLLDICPDESNPWRGQIYNLLGFLQTRLGHYDEALSLFSSASEALRGPELLVNYSDLAWLYDERGEPAQSKEYLRRVEELKRDHPTDPAEELLLPEVLAEKAWTLINFNLQKRVAAAELFERALEQQPERVEWRSSQAIALMSVLLKVQRAHEEDPENMYLSVAYLRQRVKRGEQVEEQVAALMPRIVERAHGSYSGLKPALRFYRRTNAMDMAIYWAEQALEKHPDSRYVKRCAALCYKWRVLFQKDGASKHHLLEKGVALLKEVISLYPDTALGKEIDLADLYAKSDPAKADEMYQTLLQRRMEPPKTQMLYNRYAKHLWYNLTLKFTEDQGQGVSDLELRVQVNDFLLRTPEI
uniref:Uncharacterized protein n=1 Tax=Neogobius melanostomus TaxID=47308 RepID=A0A8C6TBH7_9GOBI